MGGGVGSRSVRASASASVPATVVCLGWAANPR
jgi:hypothetical protein